MTIDLVAAPNPIRWNMTLNDVIMLRDAGRVTQQQLKEYRDLKFKQQKEQNHDLLNLQ